MKVLILGGFPGSGKTTVLLQLARYLTENSVTDSKTKVVILENEAGQKGIDDKFLKSNGLPVQTLFNGCICCSISEKIVPAVIKIDEISHPEWLIIETTGLAYPDIIQKNLKETIWLDSAICIVVDSYRWKRFLAPMHGLLKSQIECADVVLINKKDLIDPESLKEIEQDVRQFQKPGKQTLCHVLSALEPINDNTMDYIREVVP